MATYKDANNYTQSREKWNSVDKKLTELIDRLPKKSWLAEHLWLPILMVVLVLAGTIAYDQYKAQDSNQTIKAP
jgi:hypothetical protein